MSVNPVTGKPSVEQLGADAKLLVTQSVTDNGDTYEDLVRVPVRNLPAGLGFDVEYDSETQMVYIVDANGSKIGTGAQVRAGLDGLEIKAEDDYDEDGNIVQYIALYNEEGTLISRTEVSINVSSITAGDNVKLVNTTKANGVTTNSLMSVYGSEDGVTLT